MPCTNGETCTGYSECVHGICTCPSGRSYIVDNECVRSIRGKDVLTNELHSGSESSKFSLSGFDLVWLCCWENLQIFFWLRSLINNLLKNLAIPKNIFHILWGAVRYPRRCTGTAVRGYCCIVCCVESDEHVALSTTACLHRSIKVEEDSQHLHFLRFVFFSITDLFLCVCPRTKISSTHEGWREPFRVKIGKTEKRNPLKRHWHFCICNRHLKNRHRNGKICTFLLVDRSKTFAICANNRRNGQICPIVRMLVQKAKPVAAKLTSWVCSAKKFLNIVKGLWNSPACFLFLAR